MARSAPPRIPRARGRLRWVGAGALLLLTGCAKEGISPTAQDNAGFSVSSAGDINGDGFADVMVGTLKNKGYVVFGGGSGVPVPPKVEISADMKTATSFSPAAMARSSPVRFGTSAL